MICRLTALVVAAFVAAGLPLGAQTPRERIARSLEALGGEPLLRSLKSIEVDAEGTVDRTAQVQGRRPGGADPVKHEEWLAVDLDHEQASFAYREPRADGTLRWRRFEYTGENRTVVELGLRDASRGHFADAPRVRRELIRRIPHLLLLEALDHPDLLGSAPDTLMGGTRVHVVTYAPADERMPVRIYLEDGTGRLAGLSYRMDYPGLGDTRVDLVFDGDVANPRAGRFPTGHRMLVNGAVLEAVRYRRVLVNDPAIQEAFRIPEDIAAGMAPSGSVTRAAPGIYVVNGLGGFTAMFVEFRDFIMAVEAPAQAYAEFEQFPVGDLPRTDTIAETLIRTIKETVPGKPIRFVTVSHYHNDHAGGIRPFWAEGATLLTTPGTAAYFAGVAAQPNTLAPDRLARTRADAPPRIETVAGQRVVTDGVRTVEVINVGHTLHSDEALVVYFPAEHIIYQGDQFYFDGDGSFPPRDRTPVMREFARWVRAGKLSVDRIYGTHILGYASGVHLDAMASWPPP